MKKIAIIVSGLLVLGLGIFFLTNRTVGATLPVAGQTYTLAGSGTTGSATSITLSSLTIPQTGYELQDSDFSDTFYITFEPGSRQRQEIASCTTVTQNANNTATLSGCTRGLLPFTPFTASSSYQFAHGGGTSVIFSDPPQLFNQFTAKDNGEVITGQWRYDSYPTVTSGLSMATTTYQLVTKQYADSIANQGAATSTEANAGIAELATQAEMAASTDYGALRPLVLQAKYATSTITGTGSYVVITRTSDGKIDASFGGGASSIATLDANSKVVQNPANAQVTSTFSKIPLTSPTTSTLGLSWLGLTTQGDVVTVSSSGDLMRVSIGSPIQGLTVSSTGVLGYTNFQKLISSTILPTTFTDTAAEQTVGSCAIPAGYLQSNRGVRMILTLSDLDDNAGSGNTTFAFKYGGTTIGSFAADLGAFFSPNYGRIEAILFASSTASAQRGSFTYTGGNSGDNLYGASGVAAENSSTALNLFITWTGLNTGSDITVEKTTCELL